MAFHPPAPTPPGLWRRTPPAIFPVIMGLFGLGLAWRRAAASLGAPADAGEAILGAVTLLFLFATLAYVAKMLRRPKVVADDLRILPGRAGLAAGVLCVYLLSMTALPYDAGAARMILDAGLALHTAFVVLLLYVFATGPAAQRRVTPVWHLSFVGFIIAALAATGVMRDARCKLRRLGRVWSPSQPAEGVAEAISVPLFDVHPHVDGNLPELDLRGMNSERPKQERDPEVLQHGRFAVAASELDALYKSYPAFSMPPILPSRVGSSAIASTPPW
jgi:hypothetical protein